MFEIIKNVFLMIRKVLFWFFAASLFICIYGAIAGGGWEEAIFYLLLFQFMIREEL